jgi:ATP-dependent helicase/nuclease subunit A
MSKPKNIPWTPAQQKAIETVDRGVLVTASAGTGKTAVLSQRVVGCITDGPVQANAMLVLTFTDAAGEEMRSRIAETLYRRYMETRDPRIQQQLLLLDRAYISTIHSFCRRILTEFFYLIDLDPGFGILDADEQRLLKDELLDETLEQAWADDSIAKDLQALFAGRRVQPGTGSFVDLIIPLTEFLDSIVSREVFYDMAGTAEISESESHQVLLQAQKALLLKKLNQCQQRLDHVLALDSQHCDSGYVTDYIQKNYSPVIETCLHLLEQDRFDLCAEPVAGLDIPRMPGFKKTVWDESIKDVIKKPIEKTKETLKGLANFALLCPNYHQRLSPKAALQTNILLKLMQRFDTLYAASKQRRNVLDFADLEHRALDLLNTHPEAANKLSERFEFIFVDEYQDINAVQEHILQQVSRRDNVFVVGDVKQSIYGFRQSKPDIFLSQLESAGDGTGPTTQPVRVDLRENFRCRSEIVDFVNALFGRTMKKDFAQMDYDQHAELVCGFDYPAFKAKSGPALPVELALMDEQPNGDSDNSQEEVSNPIPPVTATQRQAAWIAQRIRQIVGAETGTAEFQVYDKKTDTCRDVRYRDIVIVMRSLSHKAQVYTEMLRLGNIPVRSQSGCGYFEATEISDCLCLLKVLDHPDRDIELAALLRSPVFSVTDTELATVRMHAQKHSNFYNAVKKYASDGGHTGLREKLKDILSQINAWRQQVRTGSLADFLDDLFHEKRLLSFYAALPNGSQRKANLLKLHDHAIHFEHFRTTDPGAALGRFVEFLEKLDEAQQDWAPAEPDSGEQDAVRIMSIHKSKGLEFPVVFVAELNTPFNMQDASGQCLIDDQMVGLQVVDKQTRTAFVTAAHQVIADRACQKTIAEEMRILYVALTRAREKLILTGNIKLDNCTKLLREWAQFRDLPAWKLAEVRNHLEWVLAGFSNQALLHQLLETDYETGLCNDELFYPHLIERQAIDSVARRLLDAKRSHKTSARAPKAGSNLDKEADGIFKTIKQNLAWTYQFSDITETPAKLSVSKLTHREDEFSAANIEPVFSKTPSILHGNLPDGTPDAMSLGSATHLVIEKIDLSVPVDSQTVEATISELIQTSQITNTVASAINAAAIVSFFESALGQLAQKAGKSVLREWPFTYGLNAAELGAQSSNEVVVVQGIIDMIIPTEGGVVILDFKTDHIKEADIDKRAEMYKLQLQSYAKAAAHILQQPIAGAWLHFLTPEKPVKVELP